MMLIARVPWDFTDRWINGRSLGENAVILIFDLISLFMQRLRSLMKIPW